tara:strand:- start:122 stop:526 length:405 start_codon:yes stop_codon:yes gene_type:complete
MSVRSETSSVCSVHDTGGTAFIVVAPEPDDVRHKDRIYDEVRHALTNLFRQSSSEKRVRVSLIAPPGHIDFWGAYAFIAPKVKALRLDFKDHSIQVSAQKIGEQLGWMETAVCQMLCLAAGVTWGGCVSAKRIG